MLPNKQYTPEDILHMVLRRKWWIVIPGLMLGAAAYGVAKLVPNAYRAETVILLVPPRVAESYVRSAVVNDSMSYRLQSITEQILSRTALERVLREERRPVSQSVLEDMREHLEVKPVKDNTFKLSYVDDDPTEVMRVTNRLASMFIEENLKDRTRLAEDTNAFLESQLEETRRRLKERETALEQFRTQYAGELPSQVNTNLQVIQSTQLQLQTNSDALNRVQDRKLVLERQLADGALDIVPVPAAAVVPVTATTGEQLDAARETLKTLQGRYTPEHPDVIRAQRNVTALETKLRAERVAAGPAPRPEPVDYSPRERRRRATQLEIDQIDRDINYRQNEEKRLRALLDEYQQRVELAPKRESAMTELTRDYQTLQDAYKSLLAKKEDSRIAANLERERAGEQFKVIDPARRPEQPFKPNRRFIAALGLMLGIGLGIGLGGLLEYRDESLYEADDAISLLKVPVIALIPVAAARRRSWFKMTALASGRR
jgi:protein tyrosine kinase modulator